MAEPRTHHYQFAHQVLPTLAQRLGARMVTDEPPLGYTEQLKGLWDSIGERLPAEDRLPSAGITGHRVDAEGLRLLLVELPTPAAPAEAHFVAVVLPENSDDVRVFTLERATFQPADREDATMLGSWSDRSHFNLGPGPHPEPTAFIAAIHAKLAAR
ncbi:hypothetical protein [Nocardia asteroides]|uniref:hypothetical protein n=1 Tax=Nocardia asteroides TaxID=1824 RepID=UPI001E45288C|nr:hypothetical protein [Nocardia asteroides]UGT54377.1 hypothetical protein LTT85_27660 [Nocardia asteroides]